MAGDWSLVTRDWVSQPFKFLRVLSEDTRATRRGIQIHAFLSGGVVPEIHSGAFLSELAPAKGRLPILRVHTLFSPRGWGGAFYIRTEMRMPLRLGLNLLESHLHTLVFGAKLALLKNLWKLGLIAWLKATLGSFYYRYFRGLT